MSGRIVMIQGRTLTIEMGTVTRQFTVKAGATITLNGKEATLDDLQMSDMVMFTGDPIYTLDATRQTAR